ncbi:MAG: hypothetical protein RI909_2253 [Bacteroidota bacterium]|jgi:hypothetical protein
MKAWLHQTKKSLLIGLMSLVLLFSLGHIASVKSSVSPLRTPWKTEAADRSRQINAHRYSFFVAVKSTSYFCTRHAFSAYINAHTLQASQRLKISYHPKPADLLQAHHTYLKVAPGTNEYTLLLA